MNKTKCIYFAIEKVFDKYLTIWEKVSNIIIKKINSELKYNKKYLKGEKRFNTKENFQYFFTSVVLFDLAYGIDRNYYPKLFLEKRFLEKHKKFWFLGLLKYKKVPFPEI